HVPSCATHTAPASIRANPCQSVPRSVSVAVLPVGLAIEQPGKDDKLAGSERVFFVEKCFASVWDSTQRLPNPQHTTDDMFHGSTRFRPIMAAGEKLIVLGFTMANVRHHRQPDRLLVQRFGGR